MKRILMGIIALAVGVVGNSPARAMEDFRDLIQRFSAHVDTLAAVDESLKKEIGEVLKAATDEYSSAEAITSSLARIYPEYENAIMQTQESDPEPALELLGKQSQAEDPFLAADATFLLARILMNEEQHELALPHLERLAKDLAGFTLHAGPAMYFSGVAQASLLDNQSAIKSLNAFLDQYPQAPERLRVAAWRLLQTIDAVQQGQLTDVLQRMDYSRRRLQIGRTDTPTQTEQKAIVTMLQQMIEEEEKKECSGQCNQQKNQEQQQEAQGEGEGKGEGQGKSDKGAGSNNPNGTARRTFQDGPASPWSKLRERSRDAANNAIKQRLPVRYRSVVERYYETISGNEPDDR